LDEIEKRLDVLIYKGFVLLLAAAEKPLTVGHHREGFWFSDVIFNPIFSRVSFRFCL